MKEEKKRAAVGIDVGGTNTVTGLVDENGKCLGLLSFKTQQYQVFDDYVKRISQDIDALLARFPDHVLVGIGAGAPNGNRKSGYAENIVNIKWWEKQQDIGNEDKRIIIVPFVEAFRRIYPTIPMIIDNDANAAAIGEMIYGGAKGMKDFIMLTLGTGLGAGVIANGKMIYGHGGTAGELGHIIVEKNGRQCNCGRQGCLENYVSATGIVRTVYELFCNETMDSSLRSLSRDKLTSEAIYEAAVNGDALALKAFEITARYLGEAIANQVAFTFPEAIFLFGGLAKSGDLLFKPTKHYMEEAMLRNYKGQVKLLPSGIDNDNAAILGASALVWEELDN